MNEVSFYSQEPEFKLLFELKTSLNLEKNEASLKIIIMLLMEF